MKTILLALLLQYPIVNRGHGPRAERAAEAIEKLVSAPGFAPLPFAKGDARESTAKLYFIWLRHESAFRVDALGDAGQSCGAPQINRIFCDCDRARRDLDYSLERMHAVMRAGLARCGTLRGALSLYASGKCTHGLGTALRRCKIAGVAC